MIRLGGLVLFMGLFLRAFPQYPLMRPLTLLDGQRSVQAEHITQDHQRLIWTGGPNGLFRTDGERTEAMLRTDGDAVTAICAGGRHVFAALAHGAIIRCDGAGCDTLWTDTLFRNAAVRSLLVDARGAVWAGTYGAGVHIIQNGSARMVDLARGLTDDHVNAQCPAGEEHVAVATDQGIALLDLDGRVVARFGEAEGAPDNLLLAVCPGARGTLWAGGDRGGPFSFDPAHIEKGAMLLDTAWRHGPVTSLVATLGRTWVGTADHGTVVCDLQLGLARYTTDDPEQGARTGVRELLLDADGAVWWCDGTSQLRRADPDVLITARHEDVDMHRITALALGPGGDRIAFATRRGVFTHAVTFQGEQRLERYVLPIDSTTQVVALHTDARGWLWAGTFGAGVFRISPNGRIERMPRERMPINENVLAIRSRGSEVWFATLGGVYRWTYATGTDQGTVMAMPIPGSGFTFDLLPMPDGTTLVATHGSGIVRIARDGSARILGDRSGTRETFYSLCADSSGTVWACGPSTGLCRVDAEEVVPVPDGPGAMDDVYILISHGHDLVMMGRPGLIAVNTRSHTWLDLTAEYGLRGAAAELNTACVDRFGAVWIATDKGLMRLGLSAHAVAGSTTAVITRVEQGGQAFPLDVPAVLPPQRDFLFIQFSGLHYAAPEEVQYIHRLISGDTIVRTTRDREVTLSGLAPGDYRFEVAALSDNGPPQSGWSTFSFTVQQPWWRTSWAIGGAILLIGFAGFAALRLREGRIRAQERIEREKVRFQMQVLRSQVNPHFLFNSFNTLIALIEDDSVKAVKHVEQLSDFFREILQVRDKDLIPLRDELHMVDTYFLLEQRRFGDRIALRTKVTQGALSACVPPLTVQLLVENALKHNRAMDAEPLVISITAENDRLVVSNPYRPRDTAATSTGFGIASIRQRFLALSDAPVSVGREGDQFVARIPLIPPIT